MSTIISQQANTKTHAFKSVFTSFVVAGEKVSKTDKLLGSWNSRTVTFYGVKGADFTSYSVKTNKRTAADVFAMMGLIISLMLPILLIIKAASKHNKQLAKQVATLPEVPEPVVKTSGKVTQNAGSLHPSKKASHATPPPADPSAPNGTNPANGEGAGQSMLNYMTFGMLGSPGNKPLHEKDFVQVNTDASKKDVAPAAGT